MENKINNLLAGQFSNADETELEAELNALMSNEDRSMNNTITEASLPHVPMTPILPQAPLSKPEANNSKELALVA